MNLNIVFVEKSNATVGISVHTVSPRNVCLDSSVLNIDLLSGTMERASELHKFRLSFSIARVTSFFRQFEEEIRWWKDFWSECLISLFGHSLGKQDSVQPSSRE